MPIRLSGMSSGLDTESIINELVKAKSAKLDTLRGDQKKLTWTQDKWKELNTKVYGFYTGSLSDMRYKSSFTKKSTKVTSDAVSVVTAANAPNVAQNLKIENMAKAGYLTGGKLSDAGTYNSSTKVCDAVADGGLGVAVNSEITIKVGKGETKTIAITADTTIGDITKELKSAGVNASFDAKNQRFYISSTATGKDNDFTLGGDALGALGLVPAAKGEEPTSKSAIRIEGADAKILLNNAEYTSNNNTFDINGLTISINYETDKEINLSTTEDTDGIYDMVKNFFKDYNKLINEMDSLYNADSAAKYKMLTDEQKEAMTDKEVEEWEDKIKSALLRRDSTLGSVADAMKVVMLGGVTMSDGSTMYLSDFGVSTLGYFNSGENEKNAFHIDGDKDDEKTRTNTDKLRAMIASDPNKVADFFSSLAKTLYDKVDELMKSTSMSSAFTIYNDKQMKEDIDDYNEKILKQEQKITDFEDRYYKKFSKMEKALSTLESKNNAVSQLFNL